MRAFAFYRSFDARERRMFWLLLGSSVFDGLTQGVILLQETIAKKALGASDFQVTMIGVIATATMIFSVLVGLFFSGRSKTGLLAASLVGFALTLNQRFLSWDPLAILFALPPQALQYYPIAIALAVSSVFQFRPWCRFLCPLGAAFLVLSRLAPLVRFFPVRVLPSCDFGVTSARDVSCIRCQRCCRRRG